MSYQPAQGPARQPADGGLIAVAVLLLAQLAIELGILGYDLSQAGAGYLTTALGFTFEHYVAAPVGFFGQDAALCVALVVLVVGAFSGGRWARPAAVALLGVNAYGAGTVLVSQGVDNLTSPVRNLVLNLTVVATILIAVVVAAVVAATRRPAAPAPAQHQAAYQTLYPYAAPPAYPSTPPPGYPSTPPAPSGPPGV
ncbi:hypothetical protein AB0K43_09690 [Kitasatospora sp. NPDC049258]|uniref:hypothetical protein n=1 Tax=Kitasatospora sp. NPDC049258 TaxID=3155394 RepID=UPI00341DD2F8